MGHSLINDLILSSISAFLSAFSSVKNALDNILNSFSFAACTNDGITNEGGEETSGTVSEADMFIGTWSGHGEWTFNADGTCMYEYFDQYEGHWTYDSESRTLITDVLEWNWKIINVSENMWTGEHLAGSKDTYTYSRVEI